MSVPETHGTRIRDCPCQAWCLPCTRDNKGFSSQTCHSFFSLLATNRRTHLKVSLPSSIFLLAVSAGHKDASLVHGSHGKATATSYGSYLFTSCTRLCWDVSSHKLSPSPRVSEVSRRTHHPGRRLRLLLL